MHAAVETVCAWLVEGFLLVVVALRTALLGVAFGFLFATESVGQIGACADDDVA